jgi:hypothetical protein
MANGCDVGPALQHLGDVLHCDNGSWSVQTVCPNGCTYNPNGADYCT